MKTVIVALILLFISSLTLNFQLGAKVESLQQYIVGAKIALKTLHIECDKKDSVNECLKAWEEQEYQSFVNLLDVDARAFDRSLSLELYNQLQFQTGNLAQSIDNLHRRIQHM